MKTVKMSVKSISTSRSEISDQLRDPGDAALVVRGVPRWLILKCPCGCGEEIPVNLDRRAGKAWRLYEKPTSSFTVFPSVWRDTGCQSHFIIWRNRIQLFEGYGYGDEPRNQADLLDLAERTLAVWPSSGLISYVDVADRLGEIPWDVLDACRHLVRGRKLQEGNGKQLGMFRRA